METKVQTEGKSENRKWRVGGKLNAERAGWPNRVSFAANHEDVVLAF